ncbi:ToxA protein [Saccharopolyspora erythraea NRRL 2338]|uniref:ToxA protein n=2 Tax=Saccharopolyspora erythraea TaxID=1836 RepID=A4FQG1_SACEN|nr:ToxA protein [Saccharopolyspora erythraea NRRL 2338]
MREMTDQYDVLGETYEQVKRIPIGLAEVATLMAAVPPLAGKSVLDVGCGTGFYPRLFRRAGAEVLGVDSAEEMIAHARRVESAEPLGVRYDHVDASELPVLGTFDVVTAIWLIGYAPGMAALEHMLSRLAANVRPGGDLVLLYPNPHPDWDGLANYSRYGLTCTPIGEADGRIRTTVRVEVEPPFEFESFFWPPGVVESSLERVGFTNLHRQETVVPPAELEARGPEFWEALLANPTFAVLRAQLTGGATQRAG